MTRKVQSSQLGISIFPFLAVLLCAMGALIVLLVVVNRASRNVAIAAHKEKLKKTDGPTNAVAAANTGTSNSANASDPATKSESTNTASPLTNVAATNDEKVLSEQLTKVKESKEEIQFRREHIKKAHETRAKELQDERQRLSMAEEQYRKLADQYDTLRKVVADLATADATKANSRTELEAELNRSKLELEASRKKLTDAQIAARNRKPNFAVVPYDGPNRTNRRPIYIECTADSIIVQPEGIRLSPRDFVGPNGPGNPLASVMRAVREQYIAAAPNPKSPDAEPYPLFLVRPEGVEAYMIAREAMQSYAIEVGYQTVDQDWELAFPAADPNVAQRANQALAESRQRVGAYLALSGQGGGGMGAGGSGLGGTGGGSIAGSGLGGSGGSGRRSYNLSKKGGRLIPDDPTPKISSGTSARPGTFAALDEDQGLGGSGVGVSGTGGGSGLPSASGSQQNPYGAIGGYGTGTGLPGSSGTGLGSSGLNGTGLTQSGSGAGGFTQNGSGTYGGTSSDVGGTGTGANGTGGTRFAGNPTDGYGTGANGTSASGTGAPGTGSFASGNANGANGNSGSNNFSTSSNGQQSGTANGGNNGTFANSQGSTYANGAQSGQGYSGSGTPSGPTFNGDPSKRRFGELEQRGTYASSDAGYSDGSYSPSGASSGGKSPPEKDPKSKRDKPKSLASTRGQGWGVSDRTARSNPVSRPLLLKVDAASLTLPVDPATDSVETRIPLDTITERSSNAFITAIEQRIKRWGIAGKLLYWSPELTFEIAPDGEGRFEDIQALLEGSGWTVKRKNPPNQNFATQPSVPITQQPTTQVPNSTPINNSVFDPAVGPMIPQAGSPNTVSPQRGFYPLAPLTTPQTATQNNSISTPTTTVR